MKLGVLQFKPVFNDVKANIDKIGKMLDESSYANLWVLPELASSGYNFESRYEAVLSAETLNDSKYIRFLISRAEQSGSWFVTGFNERQGDKMYNSAVLVSPNGVVGVYRKLHLFLNEKEIFEPGNLGLPVYETPWGKIGMLICYDWMFPEVWRLMALKGVALICHPSNLVLPYCQSVVPGYAITNRMFVATANRTGRERELKFTGRSIIAAPNGEVLVAGHKKRKQALIVDVDLSLSANKMITSENDVFKDRRDDVYNIEGVV